MSKKKELSPELKAECDAAKALFTAKKNALGLTQAKIAEAADISPAGVAMYLNGTNPLNAKFAAVLSRLLEEPVERFSRRLAAEIAEMQGSHRASPNEYASGAADKVLEMLRKHGKGLSDEAQQRIAQAVADSLAETPATPAIPSTVVTADSSPQALLVDGEILIPQYDVRASMGHGQVPAEYADFVRNVVVSGAQLEKLGLEYTSPANLSIITGWGQSMEGTINDKDPVIVDRGINEFAGDGIYVLTWNDMLYIKRLQMADASTIELISDNPKHPPRTVPLDDVSIHAKVLYVWNGKKL